MAALLGAGSPNSDNPSSDQPQFWGAGSVDKSALREPQSRGALRRQLHGVFLENHFDQQRRTEQVEDADSVGHPIQWR